MGLSARNYPVACDKAITAGQVVKLSDGLVEAAGAAETGPILGVAAEDHAGVYDPLNQRANGTQIKVFDDPGLIFECPVPTFKAAGGGSATEIKAATGDIAAEIADDAFNGAVLVLIGKAAESGNTDPVGTELRVTDYAQDGLTFTKASGGVPSEGDVYELYPPIGCAAGGLDSAAVRLVFSATGAAAVKVAGHDRERHMLRCMAVSHSLGVKN